MKLHFKEREVIEAGKYSIGCLNCLPNDSWTIEDGIVLMDWSKLPHKLRWVIEEGRLLIGWLALNVKWVIEGGRKSREWENCQPTQRWVIEGGRESRG